MPLLFFYPAIVAAGMLEAASHDFQQMTDFWFGRKD